MSEVVHMEGVVLHAESGATYLGPLDWHVEDGERWVLLGANGSGKTSLLRLAAAERRPSHGTVRVLGNLFGHTDLRALRARIGVASSAIAEQLRPTLTALDAVMTARYGALEPWWHQYDHQDRDRAAELLAFMGCAELGGRQLATLSQGERQRVLVARALMARPALLLLDEPAAGLDLPARELLVERLAALAADPTAPAMVLVTHHVEEIPPAMTHALLLRAGHAVAHGPIKASLTPDTMSAAYGLTIELDQRDGRWTARGKLVADRVALRDDGPARRSPDTRGSPGTP